LEVLVRPAIVFDLDGTLVDSAPDIAAALSRVLQEAGGPGIDLPTVRDLIGDGARVLVERALRSTGGPGDVSALLSRFLVVYADAACEQTRLHEGVDECLRGLAERGHPLAVCTNKPLLHTHIILDRLALTSWFPVVVGGDSLPVKKPDPAPLRLALSRLGAAQGVLVGDSATDLGTARAAGLPCLLLRHGYSRVSVDELDADDWSDGFAGLLPRLDRLCQNLSMMAS
jgi:phosphoglycolate phosphatase